MTVTLAESAVISTNQLARGIIETFIQESPILDAFHLLKFRATLTRLTLKEHCLLWLIVR